MNEALANALCSTYYQGVTHTLYTATAIQEHINRFQAAGLTPGKEEVTAMKLEKIRCMYYLGTLTPKYLKVFTGDKIQVSIVFENSRLVIAFKEGGNDALDRSTFYHDLCEYLVPILIKIPFLKWSITGPDL